VKYRGRPRRREIGPKMLARIAKQLASLRAICRNEMPNNIGADWQPVMKVSWLLKRYRHSPARG